MTNKQLWQYFQLFLEVEGALGSYKYYNRKDDWDVEYLLRRGAGHFCNTFTWSQTKQGRGYWSGLSKKWRDTVMTLQE